MLGKVGYGNTVAVFGCGPVGQFAIASAFRQGAGRVIAVDRLAMARRQGAFPVDFESEDPITAIKQLAGKIGVDRVIDAVGVDAMHAHHGPAAKVAAEQEDKFKQEVQQVAPEQNQHDRN